MTYNAGSIGVFLNGASHVHDNTIHPGSGTNSTAMATGAIGIVVVSGSALTTATKTAIENNVIESGNGNETSGIATIGILVTTPAGVGVDIVNNVIDAGAGNNSLEALDIVGNGTINVSRNRINGGTLKVSGTTWGVRILGGAVSLVNNEIDGGSAVSSAVGVEVATSSVQLAHNTIVSGNASGGSSIGVHILGGTVIHTAMQNNLTFGEGLATALLLDSCATANPLSDWRGNVSGYASVASYAAAPSGGACTGGMSFTSVSQFETELTNAGEMVGGSFHLESDCSSYADAATSCHALAGCTSSGSATGMAGACIGGVLTAYDQATFGVSTLESTGWLLKAGAPCVIAQSTINDAATVPIDWKGATRTPPVSIGADQLSGACQ